MLKECRAKLQLLFSGRYGQFNIFVLTCCLFLLAGFVLTNSFLTEATQTVANCILALLAIALFAIAAVYFLRQSPRGSPEAVPSVEANLGAGTLRVVNPPDRFYEPEHFNIVMRFLTVGFDENLCPDGEVIGKVEDRNIRSLSEAEKRAFQAKHLEDIKQARSRAANSLSTGMPPDQMRDASASTRPTDTEPLEQ